MPTAQDATQRDRLGGRNNVRHGATGAAVSIVTGKTVDATLTLPAASLARAVRECMESTNVPVVKLQANRTRAGAKRRASEESQPVS